MKYWWVNQNQTYRHEVYGGYMWSPKLNASGKHIRPYDLMRRLSPGDVVFSYANTAIKALGVVQSYCYEFPKPSEFGVAGSNWSDIGWRVDVSFKEVSQPLRTMDHIDFLRPLLPSIHSPIKTDNGGANQSYLFDISAKFALALAQLLDTMAVDLVRGNMVFDAMPDRSLENIAEWEDRVEDGITKDITIPETEKLALVSSRRGQGRYRKDLMMIESSCRVTRVNRARHLVASHTKPWRDCSNEERLDPENGFMLTPNVDHLFDKGFISFENNGSLIISSVSHRDTINRMGISTDEPTNVGSFTSGQKHYLDFHREFILLDSSR
jgi:hypothetical protein